MNEIAQIIESSPDWRGPLLAELRELIMSRPELGIEEAVKWKMPSKPLGSPVWMRDGNIIVADYLKKAVRLTFVEGAKLDDPSGLFNARLDSKVSRAIDFFEGADFDRQALLALVAAAAGAK